MPDSPALPPLPTLHGAWVRAPSSTPSGVVLFLHGILGTGGNLRGLAQALVQAEPTRAALLVDLRLHGRSRERAGPHDVGACARDLEALEATLDLPIVGVVGHSFGGKVALAFHAARPALERVALLDSAPGARPDRAGSEETMAVIAMLEQLPSHFARREDFVAHVHEHGHARGIAEWLAMNLTRTDDGFTFGVDLAGIKELLDSYFSLDLWPVIEGSRAPRFDVVIGLRSRVWDEHDRARIEAIAAQKEGALHVHALPASGHWVHVDDPAGVRAALVNPR